MWVEYNPNPLLKRVGDCSVRAICASLDIDWKTAYWDLAEKGYQLADMPSSNASWGALLKENGFRRNVIPNSCPECFTVEDFIRENPRGIYVIASDGHVATAVNGKLMDTWDSSKAIPQFYWKG